jgi:hypothetical protein
MLQQSQRLGAIVGRRRITNQWYVTVEAQTGGELTSSRPASPRHTKTFPTEIEAKEFAKAMLTEGLKVIIAATSAPHQPTRRAIAASAIQDWIEEADG